MGNLKFGTNDPSALYYGLSGGNKAYYGGNLVWESKRNNYLTFEILSGGTIQLSGDCISAQTVEYRVNNGSWNTMTVCGATASDAITVDAGDVVEWRGNNNTYGVSVRVYSCFKGTSYFNVKGRILSLFYGDDASDYDEFPSSTSYNCYTFFSSTKVVSAEELILTNKVTSSCYKSMFLNCNYLLAAPALPADNSAPSCYENMFKGCTSLVNAPLLPATAISNNCYQSMFQGCTSLVNAPVLPATTLATVCYRDMFRGCTSLTVAPELPSTSVFGNCYNGMFQGCTSLVNAPVLPAATLASYCYANMFKDCTSLNYAKCLATNISATNCLQNWLSGVSASGTFTQKTGVTYPSGASGIPEGWTVIED